MPKGRAFRLASDLALPSSDATAVFAPARRGGVARCNGGGDLFFAGSRFTLVGDHADILLGVLPTIVHIRKEVDQASLRWLLERLRQELRDPQPGSSLVAEHLAHLMLVEALRLNLREGSEGHVGKLFALAEKQMRRAIDHMHADPGRRWTLQELARTVGVSRTTFALKFKETVGLSAMDYLTRCACCSPVRGSQIPKTRFPPLRRPRLRVRERLRRGLQAGHGLFTSAIQPRRRDEAPSTDRR
ncbi:AraC family transcriptional regulator [Bordetella flabilis]|uniref:AraC family transcriptional regulator n=1 Tax=Bordetella flabilis TaxID=463014 RepID=UPI000B1433C4|nr:AraC family transcriptional regulator [Bordetella flabilis]